MSNASYVHGASAQTLIGDTIGRYFDAACERHAERDALVVRHQQLRLTYGQLRQRVDALACGLMRLGLKAGERIGIWSPNNAEWTLTQFATAKLGLVLVNINPAYRRSELEYALTKVGCRALIAAPAFKGSDYLAMLADLAPELAHCAPGRLRAKRLPGLEFVIRLGTESTPGMLNFDTLLRTPRTDDLVDLARLGETLQFDDAVNIQFTSGTTGNPKGATLSHHNILNNGHFVGEAIRLVPGDRLCIPVPLYHCFGMVMGNLGALTHGATMVYPAEGFDASATLAAVAEERCTALYGVPTMFIAQLDHPDFARHDLSSLRTGIMAGSPCPIEVMRRVVDKMHMAEVTIAYGMTETSPVSFQSATDDPLERRVSTVGRIQPHCEVKLVDEAGRVVPRGEPGELCTRGYSVMLGYWDDAAKTREAIDVAGWMHTGDLATLDAEGYCNIVGRLKDMVIRGGENLYPREIEEFLYRHPKVQDVQVIGVPDPKYGEELCACVIVRAGEQLTADELRAFCDGQIARHKVPRHIHFVESFPMTVTGKIQKFRMREQMKDVLGLVDVKTA
ncbi:MULTISPECIES: AMP-binding protein [Burkholderiales]|uniref:AMP-binding protein n=1 Tax=Burkholderiales TaxID=80840 RepID=UPI0006F58D0B|nr:MULTISPECIES: AMP-binding protein [Burkholderiales]KQW73693.1 AMP-binding protein [Methylibium sp. Root1272]MDP2018653.1 AMP-binding protein [Hydrogenophaga sp.]